jgi:hypothetical protein
LLADQSVWQQIVDAQQLSPRFTLQLCDRAGQLWLGNPLSAASIAASPERAQTFAAMFAAADENEAAQPPGFRFTQLFEDNAAFSFGVASVGLEVTDDAAAVPAGVASSTTVPLTDGRAVIDSAGTFWTMPSTIFTALTGQIEQVPLFASTFGSDGAFWRRRQQCEPLPAGTDIAALQRGLPRLVLRSSTGLEVSLPALGSYVLPCDVTHSTWMSGLAETDEDGIIEGGRYANPATMRLGWAFLHHVLVQVDTERGAVGFAAASARAPGCSQLEQDERAAPAPSGSSSSSAAAGRAIVRGGVPDSPSSGPDSPTTVDLRSAARVHMKFSYDWASMRIPGMGGSGSGDGGGGATPTAPPPTPEMQLSFFRMTLQMELSSMGIVSERIAGSGIVNLTALIAGATTSSEGSEPDPILDQLLREIFTQMFGRFGDIGDGAGLSVLSRDVPVQVEFVLLPPVSGAPSNSTAGMPTSSLLSILRMVIAGMASSPPEQREKAIAAGSVLATVQSVGVVEGLMCEQEQEEAAEGGADAGPGGAGNATLVFVPGNSCPNDAVVPDSSPTGSAAAPSSSSSSSSSSSTAATESSSSSSSTGSNSTDSAVSPPTDTSLDPNTDGKSGGGDEGGVISRGALVGWLVGGVVLLVLVVACVCYGGTLRQKCLELAILRGRHSKLTQQDADDPADIEMGVAAAGRNGRAAGSSGSKKQKQKNGKHKEPKLAVGAVAPSAAAEHAEEHARFATPPAARWHDGSGVPDPSSSEELEEDPPSAKVTAAAAAATNTGAKGLPPDRFIIAADEHDGDDIDMLMEEEEEEEEENEFVNVDNENDDALPVRDEALEREHQAQQALQQQLHAASQVQQQQKQQLQQSARGSTLSPPSRAATSAKSQTVAAAALSSSPPQQQQQKQKQQHVHHSHQIDPPSRIVAPSDFGHDDDDEELSQLNEL